MSEYSIVWCKSSYSRHRDGFLTHAAMDDPEPGVWTSPTALCGARWTDSGWGTVREDGDVGCMRCRAALEKIKQSERAAEQADAVMGEAQKGGE